MHQFRQNFRSTKQPAHNTPVLYPEIDMNPAHEANARCKMFCFAALADGTEGTIYLDLAGKFPIR